MTIRKVLIANRGEIAVRIARTCREVGVGTVAVFSDADADALHVRACDEAVRIGGDTPATSYLEQGLLLDGAARTGADAVHPGFGFLAENAEFAAAVLDAGLTWIGPSPEAIAAMGDKLEAKRRMADAGVPLLPSAPLDGDAEPAAVAEDIAYPLIVKAAAGGGGKGMRIVTDADDLEDAVDAARREAAGAFGDDRVFLERYVTRPRHVEIQILGDSHGTVVHLGERECSIQRRHQKVIEESPSTAVDEQLRLRMGEAAVAAGEAIDYVNAGTVEFILDDDGQFHFLEVNTRLQVEHPVTELVTGLDLVRLQLWVADGQPIPFSQEEVTADGHAIEARLYAEDPANDYLPATGTLHGFVPADVPGVRWDAGVEQGSAISTFYDPMVAKVIAHAPTRTEAAARLARALESTLIDGVRTNRDLLVHTLRDEGFLAGDTTTAFLDERFAGRADRTFRAGREQVEHAIAAVVMTDLARRDERRRTLTTVPAGFGNTPLASEPVTFLAGGAEIEVHYRRNRGGDWTVAIDDAERDVALISADGPRVVIEIDGHRLTALSSHTDEEWHVLLPDGQVSLVEQPRFPTRAAAAVPGATLAPMPGSIVSIAVQHGETVAEGDLLVTVEAMKMEHRVTAPFDGTVAAVQVEEGQQVDADEILVVVEEPDDG